MMNFRPYPTYGSPGQAGYPSYPPAGVAPGMFPGAAPGPVTGIPTPSGAMIPGVPGPAPTVPTPPGLLPIEESYIENILRLNLGKMATIYMTFENNPQWPAKVFRGRLEAAGRDHIIISDPQTGIRYLLLMVNLDYITFDEELKYTYPF